MEADLTAYQFAGLLLAEFSGFALWGILWLINGFFTALVVAPLAQRIVGGISAFAGIIGFEVSFALSTPLAWGVGLVAHLAIASIEVHLWRSARQSTYPTILAVGTVDVLTSALGIQVLARTWGLPADGLPAYIAYTVAAEGIAIFPERRMIEHASAIRHMLRRET